MDKKELGQRIKFARSLVPGNTGRKMTQQQLADHIGISRSYMGDIESGRTYPTFVVLNAIAEACAVSLSFFGQDEETIRKSLDEYQEQSAEDSNPSSGQPQGKFITIPVLGVIRAGEPILAQQNIIEYEYLPYETYKGGEYFGLRVTGDSMNNSRIFDGDIVVVRRQETVENGEIAVVLVNGEDATIKKFYKTGSLVTLMPDSFNKDHQPRFIDITRNDLKVLGKVVKVIISF